MLSPTLASVCAVLGIGLFAASFTLLKLFKDSVNAKVEERLKNILESEETKEVMDMFADNEINLDTVENFYDPVAQAYAGKKMLRQSWGFCLISGVFFILTAVVGSIESPLLPLIFSTGGLLYGVSFFLFSVYYLIKMSSKGWL